MSRTTAPLADAVEAAADSRPLGWLARTGLVARAVVYLVMGWLALLVAQGGKAHVDQRGALTEVIAAPFGSALVLLLALGFLAYAVWRLVEAVTGPTGEPDSAGARLRSAGRGVVYLVLAGTALSVLSGARSAQAGQQKGIAAEVMSHAGGRWVVGAAGLVVVGVGLVMVVEGWSSKFMRYFGHLPPGSRRWIVLLGRVGTVARGLVFAVTGVLVVQAAITADPGKAGGVDTALKSLLDTPVGPALVALLGAGLLIFGIYALAEARWRRVPDGAMR
jgi:hypothetical protein